MEKDVHLIIKVGQIKFINSLYYSGEMYFDTVESFNKKDANQERFDIHEGAIEIEQVKWIKLKSESGQEFEFSRDNPKHIKLLSAFKITHEESAKGNIFSCTAVTPD